MAKAPSLGLFSAFDFTEVTSKPLQAGCEISCGDTTQTSRKFVLNIVYMLTVRNMIKASTFEVLSDEFIVVEIYVSRNNSQIWITKLCNY
jgi:hypothetical protein